MSKENVVQVWYNSLNIIVDQADPHNYKSPRLKDRKKKLELSLADELYQALKKKIENSYSDSINKLVKSGLVEGNFIGSESDVKSEESDMKIESDVKIESESDVKSNLQRSNSVKSGLDNMVPEITINNYDPKTSDPKTCDEIIYYQDREQVYYVRLNNVYVEQDNVYTKADKIYYQNYQNRQTEVKLPMFLYFKDPVKNPTKVETKIVNKKLSKTKKKVSFENDRNYLNILIVFAIILLLYSLMMNQYSLVMNQYSLIINQYFNQFLIDIKQFFKSIDFPDIDFKTFALKIHNNIENLFQ
jgi:hypothetical protein